MNSRSSHRPRAKLATAAAAAAAGCIAFTASRADAGIMVDLRGVTLNGGPIFNSTSKFVIAGYGDVVGIDVYAVVTGTNTVNDEALQDLFGSFRSTGGMHGNLTSMLLAPFNGIASQNGMQLDADSDGDLDIGPAPTASGTGVTSQFFFSRSNTMTQDGVPVWSNAEEFRIATLTFTALEDGPPTWIDFLRRLNPNGTNNLAYGVWREDDQPRNATNSPITSNGMQIGWIPEPAGITIAAVTSLGLLARRRDKQAR